MGNSLAEIVKYREYCYSLTKMPYEIVLSMLSHLDVKSICSFSQVNKKMNMIANDNVFWKRLCRKDFGDACISKEVKNYKTLYTKNCTTYYRLFSKYSIPELKNCDIRLHYIIIGALHSGTHSLINKFINRNFICKQPFYDTFKLLEQGYYFDYKKKFLKINGKKITLFLWPRNVNYDISNSHVLNRKDAVFFVVDLCDEWSFNFVKRNLVLTKRYIEKSKSIIIVGTKTDLIKEHRVTKAELLSFAAQEKVPCYFTSVKTGQGVMEIFLNTTKKILRNKLLISNECNDNDKKIPSYM